VGILYRRELNEAQDKESARNAKIAELEDKFANPYIAAETRIRRRSNRARANKAKTHPRSLVTR
jgi:acetyl-CoA carboxylase carboxyltransferase component